MRQHASKKSDWRAREPQVSTNWHPITADNAQGHQQEKRDRRRKLEMEVERERDEKQRRRREREGD